MHRKAIRIQQRLPIVGIVRCCVAWFALLFALNAWTSPLFEDDSVLEITLRGPFGPLFEDREVIEYRPFVLGIAGSTYEVDLRLRGNSRRRVCDFPPLRIKLPKTGAEETAFANERKIKLVTHCRNYDRGEQDLLEEYLVYRIFNLLTEHSYRVRLMRVNYDDTSGTLPPGASQRYGFAIESSDSFEARTAAEAVTLRGLPKGRHNPDEAALVYVFQYLVANTDWQLTRADHAEGCCHNVDLFEMDDRIILLPYDFDLSGVVNAKYAFPDRRLRIKKVTQRLFRGVCTDRDVLRSAIHRIGAKREEILDLAESVPGLTSENAERAREFLEGYFEKAENEEKLLKSFERHCI